MALIFKYSRKEMADAKKKCRQYNVEYLKYGCIPAPTNQQLPMCLICGRVFSNEAMKPFRITEHPDKVNMDLSFFKSLQNKFEKRPTLSNMFCNASQQNTDGLLAAYNISLLIAKSEQPHTIGEGLILPAVSEVLRTVLRNSPHDIIEALPQSNSSVQRRIDEMADDVEDTLCSVLRTTDFALQLDESTLPGNESLLKVKVKVTLRLTISQSLCLGVEPKSGTFDHRFFSLKVTVFSFFGALSLTRGRVCMCQYLSLKSTVVSHYLQYIYI
jgi:hypothetical protein